MKKLLLSILFLIFLADVSSAQEKAKLSPLTKKYLSEMKKYNGEVPLLHDYVYKKNGSIDFISALIKVSSTVDEASLNSLGVRIGTKAGNIWTAQVPLAVVEAFTQIKGIEYIQLDEPTFPTLDSSRSDTHVDSVHQGINIPMPYNGEGVVVGVVDAGYDFSHPVFFDTSGAAFRVKKTWLQKDNSGSPPSGYAYGTEVIDSTALWAIDKDNDGSHATHVAGICAGSGFGGPTSNRRFRGYAYQSELVLVGITPDKSQWINTGVSDMIDGINYVFSYANSVSKPAVVNLSWGSPLGPRDGTGLFSQALDNMTGPGKIFVCAAGNNGLDSIHMTKTFTSGDSLLSTFLEISNSPEGKKTWVDMWGDSSKSFCVQVALFNNGIIDSTGFICLDDSVHDVVLLGSNSDTCFVTITTSSNEFNMKPRVFLDFDSKITNDLILISVTSLDGTVHFWNSFVTGTHGYYGAFESNGYPWASNGDNAISISDIAASRTAIAAGAHVSKPSWTDINGGQWVYPGFVKGMLATFSSRGPTVDGRIKPDITAPGMTVGSGVSSYDTSLSASGQGRYLVVHEFHDPGNNRDYPYAMFSGTSMASPAVTGIIALMLQVKNDLTPSAVLDIFEATATQDAFTGQIPAGGDNTWGRGKVNAYQSILLSLDLVAAVKSINNGIGECRLFPNPNTGSFYIDYNGKKQEDLTLTVNNYLGQIIYSDKWKTEPGNNFRKIDLENIESGIYFVRISSTNGESIIRMALSGR